MSEQSSQPWKSLTHQLDMRFQLTWLTSSPLLKGNRVGIVLSLIPAALALLALFSASRADPDRQGPLLFTAALFLSSSAIIIQFPTYLGRVELANGTLVVVGRLSGKRGRLQIPQDSLQEVYFAPLKRPPSWLPLGWGIVELFCALGAASAGWIGHGEGQWLWLTGLVMGLSFWPMMTARWQASTQVVLIYHRPGQERPGVIRAWATPHQANSLVNTLHGRIDWEEPAEPQEEE